MLEWKLRPPQARPGIVRRSALVDRLLAARAVPVISVVAPPGYGKTTVLSQYAEAAGRPLAWVSVDRHDNDPAVLLTDLALSLDRIEPISPRSFQALASPAGAAAGSVLPGLVSALSAMGRPVTVVLDHLEHLEEPRSRDAVAELALRLPEGSQLAVAARDTPPIPAAALRDRGRLLEIGVDDLAMDEREARALLEGAGVELGAADAAELIRRTEGWPVGLYLAALALGAGDPPASTGSAFSGDDRLLADYLRSELLDRLSPERVSFLTRTSVLDRMSGPLCDHVLRAGGSSETLASLAGSNLLVIALDRAWYRYHHLFRDLLRSELGRREPELVPELHARAAGWFEVNGPAELAIDHAQAAGDGDGVARLVGELALPNYAAGHGETVKRWFAWFERHDLAGRHPPTAVLGAMLQALTGNAAGAERWAHAAERSSSSEATMPDGSSMEAWLALLRGMLCRDGVERMRRDAELALAGLHPRSQLRAAALLLQGLSHLLEGHPQRADPILERAVEEAMRGGAMPAAVVSLAERSIVAMERGDAGEAGALSERALEIMRRGHLEDYGPSALAHAVAARVSLRLQEGPRARGRLAQAARLRPQLSTAIPTLAVQTLLELARANLELGDAAGARAVMREAWEVLRQRPDLGVLPKRADQLRMELDAIRGGTVGASTLTRAELRLLPLLSTHLSFREIGERLYLSRHTVKTQAMSIYRKLGASSRSQAVQRAREVGVLAP